jgi:cardiolipin synthase
LNLPNLLTVCRFFLVPIYLVIFSMDFKIAAFFIVVVAGATDVLDGYFARKRGQVTEMGIILDPLADKLMMIAVVVSLLWTGMIPWEAAVAFFIRDTTMITWSAIHHFRGKKAVPANFMGKLTTVLFYIVFLFIFFELPYATEFLWIVIACSFITAFQYMRIHYALSRQRQLQ